MRKILLSFFFSSCILSVFAQEEASVYFIGDAGEPVFPADSNLSYLQELTVKAGTQDVLIFMGDNLYPSGLPAKEHPKRKEMEQKLDESLKIMKTFKGRSFIIPGNHDWAGGKKNGWEQLLNMQRYVDEYMGTKTVFLLRGGCPGPVEVEITPELLLVIMDTQYLLHPWDKPDEEDGCDAKSSADAILMLRDILSSNKEKNVVIAGHHPMYSYGPHGGKYTLRQHIFPLTDLKTKIWLPLPVVGSIYPLFRSVFGSRQEISSPKYKLIRNAMVEGFRQVNNLVYISGHDHSLQYIYKDSLHFIITGSGSKSSNVAIGTDTKFASRTHGFGQLTYQKNGEVTLKIYNGDLHQIAYEDTLYYKQVESTSVAFDTDFTDSTVVRPISDRYDKNSKFREYWLGENYRNVWATPVKMPVFNIGKEHGGLEIVKLGGGNQTRSLRLEAKNGRQYVLRSLDKYTGKLLPLSLYETLVADIIQDQISAANPYGVFAVPPLAEAAGIYHTNPRLVFVPDDPRFGKYQSIFANLPVLYEERPNDEAAGEPFFGSGEKIEGTSDLIEELQSDNDEVVDQPFALRSRLFDMIIGDWDRHEDQWRWVRFDKEPKGHVWRPIPRDRDQAFFVNEGLFGWVASRKFVLPNTEGFDEHMDYPPGFNASARFFDRTFLNVLDWNDWEEQIGYLQKHLTDEAVSRAFQAWPDTIHRQVADETIRILKARRDDMDRFAKIHYLFLSEEVEIVGTNKREHFLVERLNPEETKVTVRKQKKDGGLEQVIYQRVFKTSETKEVRLYGLGGKDIFEVIGDVSDGIKVRIIGGEDEDKITDASKVTGLEKKTVIYDLKENTELFKSSETRSKLSDNVRVNAYNRTAFEYNKFLPLVSVQFNPDDGVFLGGGFMFTQEGWRKDPFASRHKLQTNGALETGALNLYYNGTFSDVIGKWDFNADLSLQRPFGVANYFGFGNESTFDYKGQGPARNYEDEIDYYRVRFERLQSFLNLSCNLGERGLFKIGPEYLQFELEQKFDNHFINDDNTPRIDSTTLYDSRHFVGLRTEIQADTRDHPGLPTKGVFATLKYAKYYGVNSVSKDFSTIRGEFTFLLSSRIPSRLVIADRLGGQYNPGNLEFYNGAYLGKETIRGYRRTRFLGRASFYHNLDVRLQLFTFRNYLLPAGIGLILFHDIGRVWLDGEDSNKWHTGKGFGLWLAPLNQAAIAFNLAFNGEETLPSVTFGFQF